MMQYALAISVVLLILGCAPQEAKVEPKVQEQVKPVVVDTPKEKACETLTPQVQECPPVPKIHPCAPCPKMKPCKPITIYKGYKKVVLGGLEKVYFPIHELELKARIDTGAKTSSLHAKNIVAFERDGKDWVRFEVLKENKQKVQIKKPILKTIKVKRHGETSQDRYVVKMRLNVADLSSYIEMSLTDRSQYEYPVLIGRNFLQGNALVDVSLSYTHVPNRKRK